MNIKKFKLGDLFYNNKFVIGFSILLSFLIWLFITLNSADKKNVTISDIPIDIPLSDTAQHDGLRVFSGQNIKAEVLISGSRIVVGQVNKSDIQVSAQQAAAITSPGNYTLELTAQRASNSMATNYEIKDVSPRFITVMVDKYREVEFDVEDAIQYKSDPSYFASSTTFSSPKVVASGPESEVSKIKRIVAQGSVSEVLTSTKTIKAPLVMYDSYGEEISNENVTLSVSEVDATIPILMKKVMPVNAVFENKPDGLDLSGSNLKVEPETVEIAASEDVLSEMAAVNLKPLDFSKIGLNDHKFDLELDLPVGSKNLSNTYSVNVDINMSGMTSIIGTLTKFEFVNLPEDKEAKVNTSYVYVSVIGPRNQINRLVGSDLVAYIDMKDKESFEGNTEMPIKIKVNNKNSCWAHGEYKVNIQVSKKE